MTLFHKSLINFISSDPITSNTIFRKKGKPAEVKKLRKELDKLVTDYEKEHKEEKEKKDKKDKKGNGCMLYVRSRCLKREKLFLSKSRIFLILQLYICRFNPNIL